ATINSPTATIFEVGQNIDFAVSVSGGTAPYTYVWNFGDGTPDTAGQSVSHSYSQAGSKAVSVRVSDLNDAQKILNLNLTINTVSSAFDASITSPANNSSFDINESINFVGSATGGTAPYTFVWNFGDSTPNTAGQTVSHSYASAGSKTATLTVTDFVGATKTATVTVSINTAGGGGGGGSTKPVISNIRVTDVTETTAIVRWTTDRNANSRVIYDTTSHPSISSASFPNFGYAHSSVSQDDSTKVTEHAVTITGLTANTTYYYRVLSQ
ncbi:MAG: PKD domain-containing protein, partial [Patescibacteria group bacterium]